MQNGIILFMTIFAFAMPIGLLIFWKKRSNLTMFPFTVGGMCYLLFAMVLEQLVHMICIGMIQPLSDAILSNFWLYVTFGCVVLEPLCLYQLQIMPNLFGWKRSILSSTPVS